MQHRILEQHSNSYEEVKNWIDEWLASNDELWYWDGMHQWPERWNKVIANDGQYFDYWIHSVYYLDKDIFIFIFILKIKT